MPLRLSRRVLVRFVSTQKLSHKSEVAQLGHDDLKHPCRQQQPRAHVQDRHQRHRAKRLGGKGRPSCKDQHSSTREISPLFLSCRLLTGSRALG